MGVTLTPAPSSTIWGVPALATACAGMAPGGCRRHHTPQPDAHRHRHQKVAQSRYVPTAGVETPLAQWKRVDLLQDVLPEKDAARAGAAGSLAIEEWMAKVRSGAPDA